MRLHYVVGKSNQCRKWLKLVYRQRPAANDCGSCGARLAICHHSQNVMSSARIRPNNTNALGLKMAARSSEVGCDTPQRLHRMAPGCTSVAQCLQISLTKNAPAGGTTPPDSLVMNLFTNDSTGRGLPKPIGDNQQHKPNKCQDGRFDDRCPQQRAWP